MGKSLKVCSTHLEQVRMAVTRSGFVRQRDLAEELEMSMSTISNYLTGRPVSILNFMEISDRLNLDWQDIADLNQGDSKQAPPCPPIEEPFIYVDRPPVETTCYEALLKPNALVRIKAPGFMGKTALVVRVLKQIEQQEHYRQIYLNLHFADETDFSDLNQFLRWFCASIGQSLGLPNLLADQWDEQFSTPKINCTGYFERNFLPSDQGAFVLCLDEVERIFPHQKVASEFLGLLRGWHEQAKTKERWRQLRLVVIHSTETYIPLNINESPFNVGLPIDLPEFTLEQIQNLSQLYGLNCTRDDINQLMEMVGGHPYLLEQAFSRLKSTSTTLKDLLQTATSDAGIYRNHLRHLWCMLEKRPELMKALAEVVLAKHPVQLKSERFSYQLFSMGLIRFDQNSQAIPRCNLYQKYFRDRIISQQ
jgi:transcriptional regulator with XRE-family HTH domain